MNFKNLLVVTKGDDATFNVSLQKDGSIFPFEAGDAVYFTVKKNASSEKKEIQKKVTEFTEEGTAVFSLEHSDTSGLEPGSYVYDVQYTDASGRVTTVIQPSCFQLTGEVTYE